MPASPLPATSGLRLRCLHLARALARTADVDVLALGSVPDSHAERFQLDGVHQRNRAQALLAVGRPYLASRNWAPAMARAAARGSWDTVQAEQPFMVTAARRAGVPIVLDAHNVESDVARAFADAERSAIARARWRWEAAKTRRFERAAIRSVDAVVATSDGDAAAFEAWGARRVVVVPNGVDTTALPYGRPATGHDLLYVGSFGYRPNRWAALELVDEVLPRIQAVVPSARAVLVGADPGPELLRRRGPGVEVTGQVDSVHPALRAARVFVVPLRAGSGTRLKILEAMSAGIPVVSTATGVSGLDVRPGEHYLEGTSAADLADQALRVIEDDTLAASLSAAARRLVESRYDWSVVTPPLVRLHMDLAARR